MLDCGCLQMKGFSSDFSPKLVCKTCMLATASKESPIYFPHGKHLSHFFFNFSNVGVCCWTITHLHSFPPTPQSFVCICVLEVKLQRKIPVSGKCLLKLKTWAREHQQNVHLSPSATLALLHCAVEESVRGKIH